MNISRRPVELTIGQLAARTGLSVSAIRFYEAKGLVAPGRNLGGLRRFPRSDIRRLSFVIAMQSFGFTIARIRQALDTLPEGRTPNKRDWSRISRQVRAELDARIADLTRLRDRLDGCIGCGCLSLKACALHNPDDQAGRDGPGPRYVAGDPG